MVWGDLDSLPAKNEIGHQLTPCTKTNSTWVKDVNISHDTMKVLKEK